MQVKQGEQRLEELRLCYPLFTKEVMAVNFSGNYTLSSPAGELKLTLKQGAHNRIAGTLTTTDGAKYNIRAGH